MVYLNGAYLRPEEARVPVDDRGYQFADGVYEVVFASDGRYAFLDRHMERLARSAEAIRLPLPMDADGFRQVAERLASEEPEPSNTLYLQITRGAAPRDHRFPEGVEPTVVAYMKHARPPGAHLQTPASVITVPDERWLRCDIKSVSLLPNILARQRAVEAGAQEAVLVRNGLVTECASANLFAVRDGVLITHPAGQMILSGITREVVIEEAGRLGIPILFEALRAEDLFTVDEIFMSGSTTHVHPVGTVNGRTVADAMGPVTARLQKAYFERVAQDTGRRFL